MGKLYCAETELVVYLFAESRDDAINLLRLNLYEEARNLNAHDFDVYEADSVHSDWWNAFPYGETNKKCSEIIEEIINEKKKQKYIKEHYIQLPGM